MFGFRCKIIELLSFLNIDYEILVCFKLPEVQNNFNNIRLFPKDFKKYLVTEVGYKLLEVQTPSQHPQKRFNRKIFVCLKPYESEK